MNRTVAGVVTAVGIGSMCMVQAAFGQAAAPAATAPAGWWDKVTVKGDIRYRYETIADDSKTKKDGSTYTRARDRIRARVGVEGKVNDNVKAGVEFSTGQSDPVSGNQTIGDGFIKKDFKLNLAYFDYNFFGDNPNELHAIAGKMKNPFIMLQDDLVWDGDATPEGLAMKGQYTYDMATLMGNAGYMWLQERSDNTDSMLTAGQLALRLTFMPEIVLTLGGSLYGFNSLEGFDCTDWEGKNSAYGNSSKAGTVSGTTTNKAYKMDYVPTVYFAQVDLWTWGYPVTLSVQSMSNKDADDLDSGKAYGISFGKAKNPETFELGYSYAELEKDATVGYLTDSDRWGGGTDGKGSKIYGKYQIAKNFQLGATYFADDRVISDSAKTKDYDRFQLDLVASF